MTFPFSAVVGQEDLRLALLLTAVDPGIGGVLVRGEKGTAKSTVVRALAALLPEIEVVDGDRFGVVPDAEQSPDGPFAADAPRSWRPARLVELPVGASEDRLVGSLDLQEVLSHGRSAVQPGLLAAAHRGVLYVDEVNLLHDHLVDLLLDAAASGRAHVERDGVSMSHPATFLLVGTMNPEEGELRPQLLDRFGLTVQVSASRNVDERTEVVRRRLAHDADPSGFAARFAAHESALRDRLRAARSRVGEVALPDAELVRISALCAAVDVDGMRADVVLARTAVAHVAWRGGSEVTEDDVRVGARLALPHRRRRDPFDEPHLDDDELERALAEASAQADTPPPDGPGDRGPDDGRPGDDPDGGPDDGPDGGPDDGRPDDGPDDDGPGGGAPRPNGGARAAEGAGASNTNGALTASDAANAPFVPQGGRPDAADGDAGGGRAAEPVAVGAPAATRLRGRRMEVRGVGEGAPGRRSRARGEHGRRLRAVGPDAAEGVGLHLPATVLAAARRGGDPLVVEGADLRRAVREGREGNLVLFCVDASGSMAARRRMSAVTGAAAALLRDAYQRRDKVGVVTFRGADAEVALPPTSSTHAAHARLADLRTGGRTPLAAGLARARRVLRTERTRDPRRRALLVVLTDGRATGGPSALADALAAAGGLAREAGVGGRGAWMSTVVVDCESGPVRLGLAGRVAAAAGGSVVTLEDLTDASVAGVVDRWRAA